MKKLAILGTVGIPASYGGFETLAENLVRFHAEKRLPVELTVYCSSRSYPLQPENFLTARLHYVPLNANGVSSIAYDVVSALLAVFRGVDVILLLGVSGAIVLPVLRLFSSARIVTNIDGVEWKRDKWKGAARLFLRFSERLAVRFSHQVIADNGGIADYVVQTYGRNCHVIAYGGDHAVKGRSQVPVAIRLPQRYALALCRIEPENNISMILEAFAKVNGMALVFIGNWNGSDFGRRLRQRFSEVANLQLLDPIYDLDTLYTIRGKAMFYVHGHSAGGTNPSLVEMMHFGIPILAYDCIFNRHTTQGRAIWFQDSDDLAKVVSELASKTRMRVGAEMMQIARRQYTWSAIGNAYFSLLMTEPKTVLLNRKKTALRHE